MSDQPKRFDPIIDDDGLPAMDQFREGDYVLFSDYAKLQAENAWLRKAGDAMADWFKYNDCRDCRNDCNGWMTQAWNAAKDSNATK